MSLCVQREWIERVKTSVTRAGYPSQRVFADDIGLSRDTVSRFLQGRPVHFINAEEICEALSLDWKVVTQPLETEPADLELSPSQSFYVERPPVEALCYAEILKPGALIRIKSPRQMGKTSLMNKILDHARKQNYRTVKLHLGHCDEVALSNLDTFLRWFCEQVRRKLEVSTQIDDVWLPTFGSKDNCTAYFEEYLLPAAPSPLVLALDEVGRLFEYPEVAKDFFGLLRAWHEESGSGEPSSALWAKFRLVLVHSTEIYIPLEMNESPFNVGLPIELPEFTLEQASDLVRQYEVDWEPAQVEQLMSMVGGHPSLMQEAMQCVTQQNIKLEELLKTAPTEAEPYGGHLRRHLRNLTKHPELMAAFHQIVTAKDPITVESELEFQLYSMGLVVREGNRVTARCDLYRQFFQNRLVKT
jgi:AAA-like domain